VFTPPLSQKGAHTEEDRKPNCINAWPLRTQPPSNPKQPAAVLGSCVTTITSSRAKRNPISYHIMPMPMPMAHASVPKDRA
jgi:hypothetical protein